jgi:hypothetical protein
MKRVSSSTVVVLATAIGWLGGEHVAHAQLFQPPTSQTFDGTVLRTVLRDLNDDGIVDALVLNHLPAYGDDPMWEVRINDGAGNFTKVATLTTGLQSRHPAIGDLDDDLHADVVIPSDNDVIVFWGDGQGNFAESTTIGGFLGARSVAIADLDGDSHRDLIVGDAVSNQGLVILRGVSGREFSTRVGHAVLGVSQVWVGEVNGDSRPDLFTRVANGALMSWVSIGLTSLSPVVGPSLGAGPLALGDLNGDPLTDAAFARPDTDISVYLNNFGSFTLAQVIPNVSSSVGELHIGDVDGDQTPDIVAPLSDGTNAVVLHGQGNGQFTPSPPFAIAQNPVVWSTFGDVNGDGAIDIVAGGATVLSGGSEFAITLHTTPVQAPTLQISAQGASATAGSDGMASVTVTASVQSGQSDVSFAWFEGPDLLGSGPTLTVRLPAGEHTLTVRANTPDGLSAEVNVAVSIVAPPPPDATLAGIQGTLDARLDATMTSRASQASITDLSTRAAAIEATLSTLATQNTLISVAGFVQTQLDAPISSRASTADLAAIGTKIDQLQSSSPTASLTALTQAINQLSTSMAANQTRIAIEQALARVEMIASFYLPAAHGGQLEVVRSTVVDVIDKSDAAGGNATNVAKARRALTEADARKGSGDYRGAYLLYAGAYQLLGGIGR